MQVGSWLAVTQQELAACGIGTAKLDAELLLADALTKNRVWLHTHPEATIPKSILYTLNKTIERRMNHEPIAYIRGRQEFYGREFIVSPDTLTPRPETETMIKLLVKTVDSIQMTAGSKLQVVDVGTGSGCIIITAALELLQLSNINHQVSFLGIDISEPALKIARKNAKKLGAKVKFKMLDLTENALPQLSNRTPQILLANLPYVPTNFTINLATSHEPKFAIFGGQDGLDYYRHLFSKAKHARYILTESLPPQHEELRRIATNYGFEMRATDDFIQLFERI